MGMSTLQVGPRTRILTIEAVSAAHSGVYRCLAKNDVGEDEFSADLRVSGAGKTIRKNVSKNWVQNSASPEEKKETSQSQ
jgi:hypothetical protein